MKTRKEFAERRRLRTIVSLAFLAAACGGPSLTDTSNSSEPSPTSTSSQINLVFDVDTPAHKRGTIEGNGTAVAFDFARKEPEFLLEVTMLSGEPLVAYAATPDHYIQRVLGNRLEIKWSRAPIDARTTENTREVVAPSRQTSGDERLLADLTERPEYPLLNVLNRALKTAIEDAAASEPPVLELPGEGGERGPVCLANCRADGHSTDECNRICLGAPPYVCTPTDNSGNHYACLLAKIGGRKHAKTRPVTSSACVLSLLTSSLAIALRQRYVCNVGSFAAVTTSPNDSRPL